MADTAPPAAPGWVDDGEGSLRWWDGEQWGPAAPPERTAAVASHCGLLLLYFVGPLVIRQTVGRRDPFVRQHATEALNAQITFGIVWNLSALAAWGLAVVSDNDVWNLLYLGMAVAFVWLVSTSIAGARRAARGEAWRYPAAIRFVPGGWPTGS